MLGYTILLIAIVLCYATLVWLLDYIPPSKIVNGLFCGIVVVGHIFCMLRMAMSVGLRDWNFTNTLPTANVSPFMYLTAGVVLFLPKKVRNVFLTLISLLAFGLFVAGLLNCVGNIARNYAFHATIAVDSVIHAVLSLFGVYLVKSGQVEWNKKNAAKSGLIIMGVAFLMLVLNLFFHTAFFGLSLEGKHNIYNVVLCESGAVNAILYFSGLLAVLIAGYFYQKWLTRKEKK